MVVRIRRPSRGATFVHPMDPAPRTAVLAHGFRETRLARMFPQGWSERLKRYGPASAAGSFDLLKDLADRDLPISQALVVFTYPGGAPLLQDDRDWLWDAFGVPIFEQHLGPRNRLLATECDAHSGLHVISGCEGSPLEHDVCACGNPTPRLTRGSRVEELSALLA